MVIAVNTRFLLKGKLEGIGWFSHQIFSHMVRNHPEHQFIFLFDRPYDESYVFASNVKPIVISPPARHAILWKIWFDIQVPRMLKKYKADVFVSPDGFASLRTKVPQCLVVHDLGFVHYPKHVPKLISWFLNKYTPIFIAKAKKIIAVSQFTKSDIIKQFGTDANKIEVVYNAAHQVYQPISILEKKTIKDKYADGENYFVYAGSLHPRKNIVNLLKAFAQFKKFTQSNMKLLLIGRLAWLTKEIEAELLNNTFAKDIVRHTYMEAEELSQVIGSAYAMVYVSKFEGFGIPILEAINCHVPAIVSNTTSMPEVGGEAALQVNPHSITEIADAMRLLYNNENEHAKLVVECKNQAAKFDWAKSAEQLFTIIQNM
jgi:glycosyltransferase involved in cell wall biosynthesis